VGDSGIPVEWDDVTPEWMTAAIAGVHPGAEVADVALLLCDDGTNRRARFRLTYATGSGPETVFVKSEAPAHREVHARNGNLFNEADLYASGVTLPVDHPRPYRVIIDRPGLDYAIVMEDLDRRGADPRDATRPLTVDQVANGLRGWRDCMAATGGSRAPRIRSSPGCRRGRRRRASSSGCGGASPSAWNAPRARFLGKSRGTTATRSSICGFGSCRRSRTGP
jgi:hypothetical protein